MRATLSIPMSPSLRRRTAAGLLLGLCAVARPLVAQDVSLSALRWTDQKDPPDEMPALTSKPRVDFPEALRGSPDVGYIIVSFVLDPKARRLGTMRATTTKAFERAYEEAADRFRFTPGKRDGKPVNTAVTLAIIFNPASAAADKPEATPRLLDASTVHVPRPKGAKPDDHFEDQVVFADVSIDETGRITAVKNAPPELAPKIQIAAKNWRFAPARRGGQPVAAELRVPFVIEIAGARRGPPGTKPTFPRVISQQKPIYPFAMRASGMRGEVVVDFFVDIEGRVRNAYVVRSLNPAFDDPALEAVRQWRFEPGRAGEEPIRMHMQVPVIFQLDGLYQGGENGMNSPRKPDLSKLPEEFRYDTAPRLIGSARAVYPYALLAAKREGKALIRYLVDERGRVAQATVGEASAPEFGEALLAAVEQFRFEPAVKNGRPSRSLQAFSQEFKTDEGYQLVSDDDLSLLRREQRKPETIVRLGDLDEPLKPISQRPPRAPLAQLADGKAGEATIEFLVDEEGRARLPRVVRASADAFGYAAMQAIASWRFEPPTRGGRAAIVRAILPVKFAAMEGAAAPEAKDSK